MVNCCTGADLVFKLMQNYENNAAPCGDIFQALNVCMEFLPRLPEDGFGTRLRVQEEVQSVADDGLFGLSKFVILHPTAFANGQISVKPVNYRHKYESTIQQFVSRGHASFCCSVSSAF